MASKQKASALWLTKDGELKAFAGADVEQAKKDGWEEPTGMKPNGEPWNPEPVEGVTPQAEFVANHLAANAEIEGKRAEKKAADADKARAAGEKAAAAIPPEPDFKVQIVDAPKKK